MKVVLSTIGKFHTFDLARQLHKRGALKTIYSGYPLFKLKKESLPKQSVKTFPYLHAPYMRFAPRYTPARFLWEWQDRVWFDRFVAGQLPECDVFCGLSGSGLHSGRRAKSRGAKYVCDRGSAHIRVQDRILREEFELQGIPYPGVDPRIIMREEEEYEAADLITVPSAFAMNTFLEAGVPRRKMRLATYGVDLGMFHACTARQPDDFNVVFVGGLSVRKGIRYLLDAFQQLQCKNKRLTLVGTVLPEMEATINALRHNPRIKVRGHVPQEKLKEILSASHALVLPSVEDGLGLVQVQALACGCPVIATQNTGAQDVFTDGKEGFIVPIRDAAAIAERLQRLADDPELSTTMSQAAVQRVKSISGWDRYGDRMFQIFSEATVL
jgi:glycosyltransferase involved in cell wall biosynthesis